MPTVRLPNKQTISFPEGTPVDVIEREVSKLVNATADVPEIAAPSVVLESGSYPGNLTFGQLAREFKGGQTPEVSDDMVSRYKASGIDMNGAPPEARYLANLGLLDSANSVRMAKAALENTLGNMVDDVEVTRAKIRGSEEDSGPIVWRARGDKQWKFFNAPGLNKADLAATAPHAAQIGAETLGGVTGAAAGAAASSFTGFIGSPAAIVIGTTLGEGAMSFAAEYKRLKMGQERGLPITDDEIWSSAYTNGGLAALGAAGLPLAVKAFKVLGGKKVPAFIRDHASVKQIDEWMSQVDSVGDDVPRTLGQIVPDDPKLAESKAVLLNLEKDMSQDEAGDAVREIVRAQNVRASKQLEGITGVRAGMDETELAQVDPYVGGQVKGAVTKPVVNAEQEARRLLREAEDAAERSAAVVGVEGIQGTVAARTLRGSLSEGREAVFKELKDEYSSYDDRLAATVGTLPGTLRAAAKLKKQVDRRLAQSLLKEDRALITDFLKGTVQTDKKGNIVGLRQFSLLDLQREMSDLKDELRHLDRTGEAKKRRVINDLLDALNEDKKRILAEHDDPALGQHLDQLDQRWLKAKNDFERGIVGHILKEKPGSTRDAPIYQMGVKRIISTVLDPDNAKRIVQAFENPLMKDHQYALVDLRRGVMDKFYNQFVDPKTGRVTNIAGANRWLDQNRDALETLMSADQRLWMSSAQRWATKLRRVKDADAILTKTMNRKLGMKMREWDTGAVMNKLWQEGSFDKIAEVNRILRAQNPEVHKIFREASRVHALKTNGVIEWDGKIKNWFVNQEKLEDLLAGEGNNVVSHMRTVLGSDYINDLKSLNNFLLSVRREPDFNIQDISRAAGATPTFYGPSQFLRVYFAPLSPRGRALTAYKQIKTESTRRALAEAVADPKKLKSMLKLRYMNKWDAAAYSILGGLGLDIILQADPTIRAQIKAP